MIAKLIDQLHSEEVSLVKDALEKLQGASDEIADEDFDEVVQAVTGTFHIDTMDHPEYAPVLVKAEDFLAGLGDRVVPYLLECLKDSDMKTDFHLAAVLGKMGGAAVSPVLAAYEESSHETQKVFCLYAIGKIKDERVLEAVPVLVEALGSPSAEIKDTATRALGKVCENVDAGRIPEQTRRLFFENLMKMVSDTQAAVRSKAFRSLGKMARLGLLDQGQKEALSEQIKKSLGEADSRNWDIAYIVRMEAKKARKHL